MKTRLLAVLEWYAEATPADRLNDGGERALNLLTDMGKGEDGEDMVTTLLEAAGAVVEKSGPARVQALRACLMEWSD